MSKNLKNQLISAIVLSFFLFFNIYCNASDNPGLSAGETIPNPKLIPMAKYSPTVTTPVSLQDYKEGKNLLIAFMPSVTDKNNYAKVMTSAFETYFAEGLSFGAVYSYYYPNPDLKILVVTHDNEQTVREYLNGNEVNFDIASDSNLDLSNYFGIKDWNNSSEGSHVYLVDKDNKIVYASHDYKGEGEKLKTVQSTLFTMLGVKDNITQVNKYEPLVPGDKARDFSFKYIDGSVTKEAKLSDFTGKKVLIAFYPAAYSYSCSGQAITFNQYAEQEKLVKNVQNSVSSSPDDLEILMVSISNYEILSKWKNDLNLQNLKLISDNTGEISQLYNSYNPNGYNNRTIFLVDKQGSISYIDWNYKVDDSSFDKMKEQITALN